MKTQFLFWQRVLYLYRDTGIGQWIVGYFPPSLCVCEIHFWYVLRVEKVVDESYQDSSYTFQSGRNIQPIIGIFFTRSSIPKYVLNTLAVCCSELTVSFLFMMIFKVYEIIVISMNSLCLKFKIF